MGLNKQWNPYCFDDNANENTSIDSCTNKAVSGTSYDIKLDQLPGAKLGHELRVKAKNPDNAYLDSDWSATVKIVDNPILRADGATAKTATSGNAKIEWSRIPGVTRFTVNYRKLLGTHSGKDGWRADEFAATSYSTTVTSSTTADSASPARLAHTINNLELGAIYAIQLNYELNGQKVFSGRDMFVWPSKGFPAIGKRVATYPFVGHWADKEYSYRICEDTFPEGKRAAWTKLIKHAFEQWEFATDGLITMTHDET